MGPDHSLTAYPEVDDILRRLLDEVTEILGGRFIGLYLGGSLAAGGFTPGRSDIDFLVVTDGDLSDEVVAELAAMHHRLLATGLPMAMELEGSYIPRADLRHYDPTRARHPHIEAGGHALRVERHDWDLVIQSHVLREHGITVVGPPIAELIDPIGPEELRPAVTGLVHSWWAPMLEDPTQLRSGVYQAYAVLTMGRILYTLEHGAVVSKPAAANWARQGPARPWADLIDRALAGDLANPPRTLGETLDLIRYVVERCEQWRSTGQAPEGPSERG